MPRTPRVTAALRGVLARGARHAWSLDELREALAESGVRADFSTVFRSVRRLAETGVLRRVSLPDGRVRFEPDDAHHDHLQCTGCDALVPIPCMIGLETLHRLQALTGFAIAGHSVTLTGLCRTCRGAAGA